MTLVMAIFLAGYLIGSIDIAGQIDLYHIPLAHVLTFIFYHTNCDAAGIYRVLMLCFVS